MNELVGPRKPVILVIDDQLANRELVQAYLRDSGCDVREARNGLEALESIEAEEPDLVLLDIEMPGMDGLTLCRKLKADPLRRLVPIVLITAFQDRETRLRGIAAGADEFLTKPFDAKELLLRTRVLLHDRAQNKRLDAAESVLLTLARTVEARDLYTVHHAERVGLFSRAIGRAGGLGEEELEILYRGGVLHDLGKIAIPDAILLKGEPLDPEEWAVVRNHPVDGYRICLPLRSTTQLLPIIRHHHERVDGGGYPDHLVGTDIPIGARIAAIADTWDAMTSDRPYRAGLEPAEAFRRLREGSGMQWDAGLLELFLTLMDRGLQDDVARLQTATLPAADGPDP